jgi:hypothetical protein
MAAVHATDTACGEDSNTGEMSQMHRRGDGCSPTDTLCHCAGKIAQANLTRLLLTRGQTAYLFVCESDAWFAVKHGHCGGDRPFAAYGSLHAPSNLEVGW